MEKRLKNYISWIEKLLEQENVERMSAEERQRLREELLVQIGFFQHERLVHLIVTVTFALLTILAILGCVLAPEPMLFVLVLLLLILLVPYIRHYYILENGVQKLYTCYDRIHIFPFTTHTIRKSGI